MICVAAARSALGCHRISFISLPLSACARRAAVVEHALRSARRRRPAVPPASRSLAPVDRHVGPRGDGLDQVPARRQRLPGRPLDQLLRLRRAAGARPARSSPPRRAAARARRRARRASAPRRPPACAASSSRMRQCRAPWPPTISGRIVHSSCQAAPSRSCACRHRLVHARRPGSRCGGRASPAPRTGSGSTSAAWSTSRRPRPRAPRRPRSAPAAARRRPSLPSEPVTSASQEASSARRVALAVPGHGRAGEAELARPAPAITATPCAPRAARLPAAPPNWTTSSRGRSSSSRSRWRRQRREPACRLEAEGRRHRLLEAGPCHRDGVSRCASARLGQGVDQRGPAAPPDRQRLAQLQHQRGVDDVLRGRTPVHEAAPRRRRPRAELRHQGRHRHPGRGRAAGEFARDRARSARGWPRSRAAASGSITPSRPSTRARARLHLDHRPRLRRIAQDAPRPRHRSAAARRCPRPPPRLRPPGADAAASAPRPRSPAAGRTRRTARPRGPTRAALEGASWSCPSGHCPPARCGSGRPAPATSGSA